MMPLGSSNKHALNEFRYTCTVELSNISLPIILLNVDTSKFILSTLKPDDFSLSSDEDKAIFSDDQNLCDMIYFILFNKTIENRNSVSEKTDLVTVR